MSKTIEERVDLLERQMAEYIGFARDVADSFEVLEKKGIVHDELYRVAESKIRSLAMIMKRDRTDDPEERQIENMRLSIESDRNLAIDADFEAANKSLKDAVERFRERVKKDPV